MKTIKAGMLVRVPGTELLGVVTTCNASDSVTVLYTTGDAVVFTHSRLTHVTDLPTKVPPVDGERLWYGDRPVKVLETSNMGKTVVINSDRVVLSLDAIHLTRVEPAPKWMPVEGKVIMARHQANYTWQPYVFSSMDDDGMYVCSVYSNGRKHLITVAFTYARPIEESDYK